MKFRNEHDEYIYEGSVVSGVVTGEGDVAGPVGWFAGITLEPDLPELPEERAALAHYGTRFLILHESNEGFVTVLTFDEEIDRNRRLTELGHAHGLGEVGVSEKDVVVAIHGYRRVLEWKAGLDGQNLSWSEEAQRRSAYDVTEFIIEHADDLRTYMATVDRDWNAVGGDLAHTRSGEGEGFDFFAGGVVADTLTTDARALGPVYVTLNEKQAMEVQV